MRTVKGMMKRLWLLVLIAAACAGSYIWNRAEYMNHQLEGIIIIPQHTELGGVGEQHIQLQFLENTQTSKRVAWADLVIPGADSVRVQGPPMVYNTYHYQTLMQMNFTLDEAHVKALSVLAEPITTVQIYYNDGSMETKPIGKLQLLPPALRAVEAAAGPLGGSFSRGNTLGEGEVGYTAQEDFTITSLYPGMDIPEKEAPDLTLTIQEPGQHSGMEPRVLSFAEFKGPVEVRKGASLTIRHSFHLETTKQDVLRHYQLMPSIAGLTDKGRPFENSAVINYTAQVEEQDIQRMIKREGERP